MFFKLYTIDYGKGTHKPKAQTARAYPGFFTTKYNRSIATDTFTGY